MTLREFLVFHRHFQAHTCVASVILRSQSPRFWSYPYLFEPSTLVWLLNQSTCKFLECSISIRAFHRGMAATVKHLVCWQSKCVIKYCHALSLFLSLYICIYYMCDIRFQMVCEKHTASRVNIPNCARGQWRANT